MDQLIRFHDPVSGTRIGLLKDGQVRDVTPFAGSISAWLQKSVGRVPEAIAELRAWAASAAVVAAADDLAPHASGDRHWLAPVDDQDVWAAGVTYERSREARQGDQEGTLAADEVSDDKVCGRIYGTRGRMTIRLKVS